ncbi:MAG: peptidylprolyl isomerase, partial [Chitinophagaceae bacterium]
MSVIQQIQEKYAKLMAIIIAVALIIFVVMLAFENGGSLFRGGGANVVGKVNGKEISYTEFNTRVTQQEEFMKTRGYGTGDAVRYQAIAETWNQELSRLLIQSEADKLGMQISKKEVGDILYGDNPPNDLRQGFTDPNTGVYNAAAAKSRLEEILRGRDNQAKAQLNAYILQLEFARLSEKYNSLLNSSVNFPKWMIEKDNANNSQLAKVSYVMEPYTSIPDSAVKVTNEDIQDYIDKHKRDFKQEESRGFSYVAFSALPTATDSAAALSAITRLKPEFDTTAAVPEFVAHYASEIPYSEIYVPKSQMQTANQQIGLTVKDTIFSLAPKAVFGPYLDGGNYVLAKLMNVKTLPDSVKCRHILIGTVNPQTNEPVMDDSVAHKLADSIALAIRNGASFDSLQKYSTDEVSKRDNGVMTFSSVQIQEENFAKEFGQFILFDGQPGDKKVVKTSFGWHYIEILNFIKPEPHYQVAYLAKPIEASDETESMATNAATQFANSSRDLKSFDANAEKLKTKGINKVVVPGIAPTGYQIQGLGISRPFVKEIYEADKGEVLQPQRIGENWVVAVVTDINKKGTMSVGMARRIVEPLLINDKKAELIRKKLGAATTLEAAATAWGGKQIATVDSLRFDTRASALGYEPKIVGAAFNPANKGKVVPGIGGTNGVYVLRVDNVTATPLVNANVADQRKQRMQEYQMQVQQMMMQGMDPSAINLNGLREAADIKDYRSKVY